MQSGIYYICNGDVHKSIELGLVLLKYDIRSHETLPLLTTDARNEISSCLLLESQNEFTRLVVLNNLVDTCEQTDKALSISDITNVVITTNEVDQSSAQVQNTVDQFIDSE